MRRELAHERRRRAPATRARARAGTRAPRDRSAPTRARRAARSRRPRRAGRRTSRSATYGGFDTTSSSRPRSSLGQRVEPRARPRCGPASPRSRRCWRARRRARRRSRRSPTPRRREARHRARARSRPSRCRCRRRPPSGSASTSVRCRRRDRRSPRRSASSSATSTTCFGLRARDEHAAVDHEVEAAKRPRAEHVLQRFAGDPALDHAATSRVARRVGGRLVGDRRPLRRAQ